MENAAFSIGIMLWVLAFAFCIPLFGIGLKRLLSVCNVLDTTGGDWL